MKQIIINRDINKPISKKRIPLSSTQRDNLKHMGIKTTKDTTEAQALKILRKRNKNS